MLATRPAFDSRAVHSRPSTRKAWKASCASPDVLKKAPSGPERRQAVELSICTPRYWRLCNPFNAATRLRAMPVIRGTWDVVQYLMRLTERLTPLPGASRLSSSGIGTVGLGLPRVTACRGCIMQARTWSPGTFRWIRPWRLDGVSMLRWYQLTGWLWCVSPLCAQH